ncbi:hypothetical protein FHW79_001895 [Azospirillum sp. OGB3]|uniref:hypothetical protein n=1 Tax=Azospirillum sp. OGB3 TaxID=2587012 RepID=UPI001605CFD7|nr:hypothetical protein [Azospirillum sp. OGB3]MBB3264280.1 hypothetical protein [Azospirillum sp. OGB3]
MATLAGLSLGGGASAGDGAPGGATRGVVTGKYFNFNPLPPPPDMLGNPLVVANLPTHKAPKETWRSRWQRRLARFHIGKQSAQVKRRWKIQDTIASVIASVSPAATMLGERGWREKRPASSVPVIVVRHPYHLRHVFEMILQPPDDLAAERRFLELLMGRVLRKYGEQLTQIRGSAFSFENEAREYFFAGFKLERQIKKYTSPDERFAALQSIYVNYFHGRNYYLYALLRREKLAPDNKLFMLNSRAVYFMARIGWNGELLDKPNPRSLPSREDIFFLVQRDKTVLTRYRSDQDFQRQVRAVLEAFPA